MVKYGTKHFFFNGYKKKSIIFDKNNAVENYILQFNSQQPDFQEDLIDYSYVKSEIEILAFCIYFYEIFYEQLSIQTILR